MSIPRSISPALSLLTASLAAAFSNSPQAQSALPSEANAPAVVVRARKSVVPNALPATVESIDAEQIEQSINAFDSADVLKYLPNLAVRKRFIGDFDHAVMATRTSGTNFPARSLLYADGLILSNLLGNNNAFTPRWGLVTPSEITRVDAMYGPFVAAYPGNSMGAVVNLTTGMPTRLEAHGKVQVFTQRFKEYGTDQRFSGERVSASLGNRWGDLSLLASGERLKNAGQPILFASKLLSAGVVGAAGTPVTGAVPYQTPTLANGIILGSTNHINTTQDHGKFKLAYDFSPSVRASYTLGVWDNTAKRDSNSYLRDAAGNSISSGVVNVNGRAYTLAATDFSVSRQDQRHYLHGLNISGNAGSQWDWRAVASVYDYATDISRAATTVLNTARSGGAGTITNMKGTGWQTLDLDATWRSGVNAAQSAHVFTFGYHGDHYQIKSLVSGTTDWISGSAGAQVNAFAGQSRVHALWAQDAWRFADHWKATLGARLEAWRAYDGSTSGAVVTSNFRERRETHLSPKFALARELAGNWTVRGALGRAVRFPTVSELFQTAAVGTLINNDPNLKPEKTWSAELSAEKRVDDGLLRLTYFGERLSDAMFSQTNITVTPNVTSIQNIDRVRTHGLEVAYQHVDFLIKGLDVNGSVTWTDSVITKNAKFPASVGKLQPRIPKWRSSASATYRVNEQLTGSLGMRYTGLQYNTLDNSDPNGASLTGTSKLFMVDARVNYQWRKAVGFSVGVDNLNNYKAWAFHPYNQRTWVAELKMDL